MTAYTSRLWYSIHGLSLNCNLSSCFTPLCQRIKCFKKCNIVHQFSRLTCNATLEHLVFLWTLRFLFFTLLVLAVSAIQASWRSHNQHLRALNLLFVFPENNSFLYIPGVISIAIGGISWSVVMLSEKKDHLGTVGRNGLMRIPVLN